MLQRTHRIRLSFTASKPDLWIGWIFSHWEFRGGKKGLWFKLFIRLGESREHTQTYKVAFLIHSVIITIEIFVTSLLPFWLASKTPWKSIISDLPIFFPRNWRKYISFSLLSNPRIGRFYEPEVITLVNCCTTYQNDGIVLHQQKIDFGKEITLL